MAKLSHKQFRFKALGDSVANDADLALINTYALIDLTAENIYVRSMYLAHSAIDRDKDSISKELIKDLVATLPGKGFFVKHPSGWDGDSGPGEGLFYKAALVEMSQAEARVALGDESLQWISEDESAYLLEASFYLVRTEGNQDLIKKIDGGVARYVSLGFRADNYNAIYDDNHKVIAWQLLSPGVAYEGSLVWLGAQPGAQIKSLEGEDMDLKQKVAELEARLESTQASTNEYTNLKAVLGGRVDDPAQLLADVEAGEAFRKSLIDDLIKEDRLSGALGDDEASVEQFKSFYSGQPLAMLKSQLAAKQKSASPNNDGADYSGVLGGGEPNQQQPAKTKGLRDATITQKALS